MNKSCNTHNKNKQSTDDKTLLSFFENVRALGAVVINDNGLVLDVNQTFMNWSDSWYKPDSLPLPKLSDLQPDLARKISRSMQDSSLGNETVDQFCFSLRHKGLSYPINCNALMIPLKEHKSGITGFSVLLICWFSELSNTVPAANDQESTVLALMNEMPIGIISLSSRMECTYANLEASHLTDLAEDALMGRGWTAIFEGQDDLLKALIVEVMRTGCSQADLCFESNAKNKRNLHLDIRAQLNETSGIDHAVCAIIDVTDRLNREREFDKLANYDSVTGLSNRIALKNHLESYISLAKRLGNKIQLLFIDLDGFKNINDLHGHQIGDEILIEVAQRLKHYVRECDLVARFGGDEFVIVLTNSSSDSVIDNLAQKVNVALRQPYLIGKLQLHLSASIGISCFNPDHHPESVSTGLVVDELFKQADLAMYAAKHQGKNKFCRFNSKDSREVTLSYSIGQLLPQALSNRQIVFAYQPILDVKTGAIKGLEALLRWNHESLGWINPELVINIAAADGMIIELQHYMIVSTIEQFEKLLSNYPALKNSKLAINICAFQLFDFKYTQYIADSFNRSSFGCKRVTLEITESTLIDKQSEVLPNLNFLKSKGFTIAMDDFGTGYSSLSYLTRFPIDYVKMDKSFIYSLSERELQHSLVEGVITLCHSIGKEVVAEGVETDEDFQCLKKMNCDYTQGYLHSKPMCSEELIRWLEKQ